MNKYILIICIAQQIIISLESTDDGFGHPCLFCDNGCKDAGGRCSENCPGRILEDKCRFGFMCCVPATKPTQTTVKLVNVPKTEGISSHRVAESNSSPNGRNTTAKKPTVTSLEHTTTARTEDVTEYRPINETISQTTEFITEMLDESQLEQKRQKARSSFFGDFGMNSEKAGPASQSLRPKHQKPQYQPQHQPQYQPQHQPQYQPQHQSKYQPKQQPPLCSLITKDKQLLLDLVRWGICILKKLYTLLKQRLPIVKHLIEIVPEIPRQFKCIE